MTDPPLSGASPLPPGYGVLADPGCRQSSARSASVRAMSINDQATRANVGGGLPPMTVVQIQIN
ncbi:hypothetical protein C4J97_3121 [Pseudomonas orientalis]|nr:hypothetical protein C4J97_3118 [Pseudomonas orientalis]AZE89818.1 hypothetical protein C4J97_3119 [Pseudomonas orientalis]AZE89820.1 hypothetical protein C4J97_3121 [Pseudomonas orientalis]